MNDDTARQHEAAPAGDDARAEAERLLAHLRETLVSPGRRMTAESLYDAETGLPR